MAPLTIRNAIETGIESKLVKPLILRADDLPKNRAGNSLRLFNNMYSSGRIKHEEVEIVKMYLGFLDAVEKKVEGFGFDGKEFFLTAIKVDFDYFRHIGMICAYGNHNINNLTENGVWGNPDEKHPTYLAREDEFVMPGRDYYNNFDGAKLKIDVKILMERRTLFHDPEVFSGMTENGDILGNSYFVLGGIPKESIFAFENLDEGKVVLRQ